MIPDSSAPSRLYTLITAVWHRTGLTLLQLFILSDLSLPFQYHSKVSCFRMQHIEEPCSLGAHAAVVVPPTWVLRVRHPQVCGSFRFLVSLGTSHFNQLQFYIAFVLVLLY